MSDDDPIRMKSSMAHIGFFTAFLQQDQTAMRVGLAPIQALQPAGFTHPLRVSSWKERLGWCSALQSTKAKDEILPENKIRIGIVGGGIAGVSVGHALAKKLLTQSPETNQQYEIVIFDGDNHSAASPPKKAAVSPDELIAPQWAAATAKNANSLVPGAAMHVFSRKSVLFEVLRDTVLEWYELKKESAVHKFSTIPVFRSHDFQYAPPYFAVHPYKCLTAPSLERNSFIRFVKQYLYTTIIKGDHAADDRGRLLQKLASANRSMFLKEQQDLSKKGHSIGSTRGFLSLHRSPEAARHSCEEARAHGEEAYLLEWDEALKQEPRLKKLPVQPLYAVRRPNDMVSSCEDFVRAWTVESRRMGVHFQNPCTVDRVEVTRKSKTGKPSYRVLCRDGSKQDFDIVVLAAGIYTPLLAAKLGVAEYVPTFPMRGFSLTLFAWQQDEKVKKGNLLQQPFSVDSMYCTSVTPWMARWAGFGEFIGFPREDEDVPSLGPSVLARYGAAVFPDAVNAAACETLSCFRPVSPDDLPLAGPVAAMPGLFVHTGHGTLGWTTGLATGEIVAQAIEDNLHEKDESTFSLPDGLKIERVVLSPNRFVSK